VLRAAVATLNNRLFTNLDDPLPFDEGLHALRSGGDPQPRSAFSYTAATILALRGEYLRARGFLELFQQDAQRFELEFAQPFAAWTGAFIEQGLRRFGEADRYLRVVERAVATNRHENHELNARILRARLLILRGSAPEAVELLSIEPRTPVFPSWRGESLATRGMALACAGANDDARSFAAAAQQTSRFVNVSVLAQATVAVAAEENACAELQLLFELADRTCTWDPVIFALRSSQTLVELAAQSDLIRPRLIRLIQRCGDSAMARQAGLRAKTTRSAEDVLSPREREVLGLIAQGLRNREIAKALFIAESTVKVHTRHILEKLGVRTRAEAVGLFERSEPDR
jgi:ATP/maltotriose-dependent transcriptional regulator MalT